MMEVQVYNSYCITKSALANGGTAFAAIKYPVICLGKLPNYNQLINNRGDFEAGNPKPNGYNELPVGGDNDACCPDQVIPEINIQMQSSAIVAKTRKLKAVWTPEFAQDLNAYHALDAEAELTSILSEYISLEIDLEILGMLIEGAAAGN